MHTGGKQSETTDCGRSLLSYDDDCMFDDATPVTEAAQRKANKLTRKYNNWIQKIQLKLAASKDDSSAANSPAAGATDSGVSSGFVPATAATSQSDSVT